MARRERIMCAAHFLFNVPRPSNNSEWGKKKTDKLAYKFVDDEKHRNSYRNTIRDFSNCECRNRITSLCTTAKKDPHLNYHRGGHWTKAAKYFFLAFYRIKDEYS